MKLKKEQLDVLTSVCNWRCVIYYVLHIIFVIILSVLYFIMCYCNIAIFRGRMQIYAVDQ